MITNLVHANIRGVCLRGIVGGPDSWGVTHEVDRSIGVIADQTITLIGVTSRDDYSEKLRRIVGEFNF